MNHIAQSITADQSPVVPTLSNMTKYNYAIVVGLVKDVPYQTNVQQLQQFESKNFRTRKALSEDDQSQTIASFMRDMVTGNISYVLEVVRKLSQHDNCDVEFEFGDRKPTKIMIRKAGSTRAVDSLVITFRTLMSDNSESTLCMISHDDTLQSHLACSSSGFLYFVPSKEALPLFSSSFRSGEREQKFVSKVILIALDENDSLSKLLFNPNFDEIKEFTNNDREVVSRNTDKSTSSSKSAKRKSTGGSDRADKTAKDAETATAPKTTADTDESPIVDETTKKSTKKSKTSTSSKKKGKRKAASNESEKANTAAKTTATEEAIETPKTPEKTTTDSDEPVETTKKSTKKSKKSPKKSKATDPNEPEKPLRDFFRWSKANRDRIQEENPNLAFGDLAKEMGKQWKKVPDEEKAVLKAAYQKEKNIYDEQLEKYNNKKNGESDKSKNTPKTADQTTNASASTSKKKGKRKAASTESEKANKAAKTTATEEAVEGPKTPEKEKTTGKTSTDTDESPIVETTKKSTKKSKAKDPNAPKKPVHYNVQYQKSIRSEVVKENPDLSSGDINKLTAKRYKEASDEELKPFKNLYDTNMKIYKKKLEEYHKKKNEGNDDENDVEENSKEENVELEENNAKKNQGNDDEKDVEENNKEETITKTTKKGKKKKKNKSAIKKNVTAYIHFSRSKNPELKEKGIKPPQSGTVLGKLWRELPDSERAEFEEIAKKDKERYLKEVEEAKAAKS